jgi:hypothetical protein
MIFGLVYIQNNLSNCENAQKDKVYDTGPQHNQIIAHQ